MASNRKLFFFSFFSACVFMPQKKINRHATYRPRQGEALHAQKKRRKKRKFSLNDEKSRLSHSAFGNHMDSSSLMQIKRFREDEQYLGVASVVYDG